MRVLVTGADGFIGSHLTEYLLGKGLQVRALCLYNSLGSWGWLDAFSAESKKPENLEVVLGDIRDPHFCRTITKDIDIVFHLAALIAIPYSYHAPDTYIQTNVVGTSHMCLAALENGVKRFIHTSTSEVYGTAQYVPIDEKHPLQPQSPYSASKIGADSMALSYFNAFKLPVVVARPFNTYGPRQSARAIIPSIISQIAAGKKEINVGDLTPTRDLNFVLDTCDGMWRLSQCDQAVGRAVNIGSNYEVTMEAVFSLIAKLMQADVHPAVQGERIRPEKSEVFRLWCDNTQIRSLTGFEPRYSLEKGLTETIRWFTQPENLRLYKTNQYTL